MSKRKKAALIILWIEGVLLLSFLIFNIRTFTHPPFPDDVSNKITLVALMIVDGFVLKIAYWSFSKTIRVITLLR